MSVITAPTLPAHRRSATGSRLASLSPTVEGLEDLAGAIALVIIAGVGFHTSFGGWNFLVSIGAGSILGALVAYVAAGYKWLGAITTAIALVVFFTIGAEFTVFASTASGIPTAQSVTSMIHGGTDGWARLLTVVPPAGHEGNLLVVPFETAYVGALGAMLTARRRRWVFPPVVLPCAALVLAVLWGTSVPAALLLQGCGFAAGAAIWMARRSRRQRTVVVAGGGRLRTVLAFAMVAGAVALASGVGRTVPFETTHRYVLRDVTQPPLDPALFPSPLARWPYYSDPSRKNVALFHVDLRAPLPANTLFRLAAMDAYDGAVFKVHAAGEGGSGVFVKASSSLPNAPAGPRVPIAITMGDLRDVWIPTTGQPTAILADGPASRAPGINENLRFNRTTRALILPTGAQKGDRLQLTTVLDGPDKTGAARGASADDGAVGPPLPSDTPAYIRTLAQRIVDAKKAKTDFDKVQALADALKTDGSLQVELPGTHSFYRLDIFLNDYQKDPTGDLRGTPEQYVATMAILARSIDLPARVVIGFQPPTGATSFDIDGKDVRAWVEVAFRGVGWVRFDPVPDQVNKPQHPNPGTPQASKNIPPEPPPPAIPPPPTIVPGRQGPTKHPGGNGAGLGLVLSTTAKFGLWLLSIPAGAAASTGVIVLLKRRRRKARTCGSPRDVVGGAWAEYLDNAKDVGRPVPGFVTRHEAGILIGGTTGLALADRTDQLVLGGKEITERDAENHWKAVDAALGELRSGMSRGQRLRTAANLQSFFDRPRLSKAPFWRRLSVLPGVLGRPFKDRDAAPTSLSP